MKHITRNVTAIILAMVLFICGTGVSVAEPLTDQQTNAIAMLNYICALSQEIVSSKSNRLFLEDAYSSIANNIYPNSIDGESLYQLNQMMDILEGCRMLTVKRDRVQFLYEQEQAGAIYEAIPNPIDFLSFVQAESGAEKASMLANIVVDSMTNYLKAESVADMNFIQNGWELDDEEAGLIHESRKSVFTYLVNIVNLYGIPGNLTLNEKTVQDFVDWKNNDNTLAKIQFFESNADTYSSFGSYWLALAECYFDNGDYRKCLDAIESYRGLNIQIFRKDYDFAKVLPLAITALENLGDDTDYEEYAQLLIDNTDNDDWALRMFAAQVYLRLYNKTTETQYLQKAYTLAFDNVNWLVNKQRAINEAYLAPVQEKEASKGATNREKDEINKYNQLLKENRKRELPEVYEPLRLNLYLLLQLAKELKIDNSEAIKIDGILHPRGEKLFLNQAVDQMYWATEPGTESINPELVEFAGTAIMIPASYVSKDAIIRVSVKEQNDPEETVLTDWVLTDVKRDSETNIADIHAVYTSEEGKKHQWGPNSEIAVTITPKAECNAPEIVSRYTAEEVKKDPLDWLKVWEGHKNEWYDYLKVWENTVDFIYVGE